MTKTASEPAWRLEAHVLRDKLALRKTRRRSVQGYLIIPILLFSVVAERCLCKRKLRFTPTRMQASLNKPSDVLFVRMSCPHGFPCASLEHRFLELLCLHSARDLVSVCDHCVCVVTVMFPSRDVALSFSLSSSIGLWLKQDLCHRCILADHHFATPTSGSDL
jgi:hypothetical protein